MYAVVLQDWNIEEIENCQKNDSQNLQKNVYKTSEKIKSETVAPKSRQTYPLIHLSTSRNLIILECQMFGEGQKSVWINIPYIRGEELETFLNQTVTYFYHAEEILSAKMSKKNYLKTILM